ncbi:MAG: hypothetical protein FIA96_16465 [Betaproteobacteria bacterium]|nr:hypothetical protein [Betaproteobacteria bacterium]
MNLTAKRKDKSPATLVSNDNYRSCMENFMKTSVALALGFYSAIAQSMCYIVENGAGQTTYISERPPVNMAADSPSKEVQAKYPGGHMLIVPECPLTSNQQEARRLQAILEVKIATEIRAMQARTPPTESTYFPAEKPQPVFYAGTLSQDDYGYGGFGYGGYGYGAYGHYGGGYYRPVRGHEHHGPRVSHYGRGAR